MSGPGYKRAVHCKPWALDSLRGLGIGALSCLSARCSCQVLKIASLPRIPKAKHKIQKYFKLPSVASVVFIPVSTQPQRLKTTYTEVGKEKKKKRRFSDDKLIPAAEYL